MYSIKSVGDSCSRLQRTFLTDIKSLRGFAEPVAVIGGVDTYNSELLESKQTQFEIEVLETLESAEDKVFGSCLLNSVDATNLSEFNGILDWAHTHIIDGGYLAINVPMKLGVELACDAVAMNVTKYESLFRHFGFTVNWTRFVGTHDKNRPTMYLDFLLTKRKEA